MPLHKSTFEYLKPSADQLARMEQARQAAAQYARELDRLLPEGPDKTFVLRAHRSNAMWANVAITRLPDGTPRTGE
jgi:hypothetical protein